MVFLSLLATSKSMQERTCSFIQTGGVLFGVYSQKRHPYVICHSYAPPNGVLRKFNQVHPRISPTTGVLCKCALQCLLSCLRCCLLPLYLTGLFRLPHYQRAGVLPICRPFALQAGTCSRHQRFGKSSLGEVRCKSDVPLVDTNPYQPAKTLQRRSLCTEFRANCLGAEPRE